MKKRPRYKKQLFSKLDASYHLVFFGAIVVMYQPSILIHTPHHPLILAVYVLRFIHYMTAGLYCRELPPPSEFGFFNKAVCCSRAFS